MAAGAGRRMAIGRTAAAGRIVAAGRTVARARAVGAAALLLSVVGCVTSRQLTGAVRPPISPEHVQLFLEPPLRAYREIAIIDTSSKHSLAFSAEGKADVVIRRLKEEAAKLGANGLVLQEIADGPIRSVGTGLSADMEGARGTISLGVFGSTLTAQKFGRGVAVYLEQDRKPSD